MARVTCAISGIRFNTSFLESSFIPSNIGYHHPIFTMPYAELHSLYTEHTKGILSSNDSYLLFIAFLHSSGKIRWRVPAALNPNDSRTKKLVENNLAQLITVLEKTAIIRHPGFNQPRFAVTVENNHLNEIPNWIEAWEANLYAFKKGLRDEHEYEKLKKVENKLEKLILSGEDPQKYSYVIANWADKAAEFPADKKELYKKTIRECFSPIKMFNTPLPLLKEIKSFCENNIDIGSIHAHTLFSVIRKGIFQHTDYLGGSALALGYTITPASSDIGGGSIADKECIKKQEAITASIIKNAPEKEPLEKDFKNKLDFVKKKLAWRVAVNHTLNNIERGVIDNG